jgi:MSHA biogenesis protein MshN
MSLINQVLNQLEQRGAQMAEEQIMVQAVPPTRRKLPMLLVLGLALAGGVGAWQWLHTRIPDVGAENIALKTGHSPNPRELERWPSPNQSPNQSPAALVAPASDAPVADMAAKSSPAASQLSFELNSASLSAPIQQDSKQVTSTNSKPALRERKALALADAAASAQRPNNAPKTKAIAQPDIQPNVPAPGGALPMKLISSAQQADAEFRKAVDLMQQGRVADAMAGYEAALRLDAGHDAARQALVALLQEQKRSTEAERVLQERLKNHPQHTGFAMLLARLQVERGALEQAVATLDKSLPYAGTQADYQAFFAALLQRQSRHKEAIEHYQVALQLVPDKGIWLMGYGISLQAVQRNDDARESFRRALDSKALSPELQAFVQQKLKEL